MYLAWVNDCQHYRMDPSCLHAEKEVNLGNKSLCPSGFRKALLWMWALCYQNSPRCIAAPPGQSTVGYSSESCMLVPAKKSVVCVHEWFGWSKEHLIILGGIAKHKLCGKSIPIVYPQTFITAVLFIIWRPARVLLMFLLVCSLENFHIHFPKVCVQCFMFAVYGLAETT